MCSINFSHGIFLTDNSSFATVFISLQHFRKISVRKSKYRNWQYYLPIRQSTAHGRGKGGGGEGVREKRFLSRSVETFSLWFLLSLTAKYMAGEFGTHIKYHSRVEDVVSAVVGIVHVDMPRDATVGIKRRVSVYGAYFVE